MLRILRIVWGAWAASLSIAAEPDAELQGFVDWLLKDGERLENVPFAEVVEAVSGREVLPVDPGAPVDAEMLAALSAVLDDSFAAFADAEHPIHGEGRVNEISGHLENALLTRLNALDGLTCVIPRNAEGDVRHPGYPDLRLEHEASGRVFYIDPKVYKDGSADSSFRTFYYEPKGATNKILDDASHLIVGAAHGGKVEGTWRLLRWQVIDLIDFEVRLKAEFQASNRDLYRDSAVLMRSKPLTRKSD